MHHATFIAQHMCDLQPLFMAMHDMATCVVCLQKSGMAATIIGMLADVNLFWEYDNRETLMQRDKEEPGK